MKKSEVVIILLIVAALLSCPTPNPASSPAKSWVVSTLAGDGVANFRNGAGASARFNSPFDVEVDSSGNVYVADYINHRIRKITPEGEVSTFAGSGQSGTQNGAAETAQFHYPNDVATDSSGNVYVVEPHSHWIRKITPEGEVSTFAGSGQSGTQNGAAGSAQFHYPDGVATDSSGNVYVADTSNNLIRKIIPQGEVSTFAGSGQSGTQNGAAGSAQFNSPRGITVDSSGNVYVADSGNNLIRRITPGGEVSTFAGSGTAGDENGAAGEAQFNIPTGVTTDSSGNVYVADSGNNLIRRITPGGEVSTFAGSGQAGDENGAAGEAQFRYPTGVATDSSGNVYVADKDNHRIRKIE